MTRQSHGWRTGRSPLLRRTSNMCGWLPTPPSSQTVTWPNMRRLASSRYPPFLPVPPPQSRPICTPSLYLCLCVCACRCRLALTSQCFSTDAPTPLAVLKRCRESMPQAELMPQYTGLTPHVLLYRIMWMTSARCMRRTGTARIHSASRWAVLSTSLTSWPCELVMKRMRTRQTLLAAVPSRFGLLLPAVAADSSLLVQTDHASVCLSQLPISVVTQCCT